MKNLFLSSLISAIIIFACSPGKIKQPADSGPITQHPDNSHVFLWKGKAKVFVASGEHYGALVNKEFDYVTYLRTLKKAGLENTRLFLGDYLLGPDDFGGILKGISTLEVVPGKFICPWARSNEPGFARGGNKFDLDKWDPEYFTRLHDLFKTAKENDVTIEAMLFFVGPSWDIMPLNPVNNINYTEQVGSQGYLEIRPDSKMMKYQEVYVRKMVQELNPYNHFFWNVSNEPWLYNSAGPDGKEQEWSGIEMLEETKAFVELVAAWIRDEESSFPKKHLIGVDITNEGHLVKQSDLDTYYKDLDILNVHYDTPARSLDLNYYRTDKILTFNETGLTTDKMDPQYLTDGWYYLMSGGGLYGNLDYTFHHNGYEDGTFDPVFPGWYIGSGDPEVKYQLAILQKFMDAMPLEKMFRDTISCLNPEVRMISWPGNYYAAFFKGDGEIAPVFELPKGKYHSWWTNILTGKFENAEHFKHAGGEKVFKPYKITGGGGVLKITRNQ
ncbi:MAG: hypothetical protein JXA72_03015 [Bacteroidales bacterium]|nr:hypothetical protein [Bacteroidales bacterium]